uniref:Uncharacterized protein n=1 Tax=Glossina brevipalpis TaxID=37001 RepID=A0A1A9WBY3_9MUSC
MDNTFINMVLPHHADAKNDWPILEAKEVMCHRSIRQSNPNEGGVIAATGDVGNVGKKSRSVKISRLDGQITFVPNFESISIMEATICWWAVVIPAAVILLAVLMQPIKPLLLLLRVLLLALLLTAVSVN